MSDFEEELQARHGAGTTIPVLLHHWLAMDSWTRDEGLPLLLGLDPDFQTFARFVETLPDGAQRTAKIISARWLDGSLVCLRGYENHQAFNAAPTGSIDPGDLPVTSFELLDLNAALWKLEQLWDSGAHADRCPPTYFISWAEAKGRAVAWKTWATSEGRLQLGGAGTRAAPLTEERRSLTTDQLAEAFDGLGDWDAAGWRATVAKRVPAWLEPARIGGKGHGGNSAQQSRWCPLLVAEALLNAPREHRRPTPKLLKSAFNTQPLLKPWRELWAAIDRDRPGFP